MNIETVETPETPETKQQRNNGERLKERIEAINRKKISDITFCSSILFSHVSQLHPKHKN